MFLKYQNCMNDEELLVNSSLIVLFVCILDYILINGQPKLLEVNSTIEEDSDEDELFDDEIIEDKKSKKSSKKLDEIETFTDKENYYDDRQPNDMYNDQYNDQYQSNSLTPMYY
jgi:competence CoiA-like predicted nuclease